MAIMDCLLLLQCEFQLKGYIQKDCLIHLKTILFSYVYKKCYGTHRGHRHKLMDIDRRTNTFKKMHKCFAFCSLKVLKMIFFIIDLLPESLDSIDFCLASFLTCFFLQVLRCLYLRQPFSMSRFVMTKTLPIVAVSYLIHTWHDGDICPIC